MKRTRSKKSRDTVPLNSNDQKCYYNVINKGVYFFRQVIRGFIEKKAQ
jgi:hypothetical protein